MWVWEHTVPGTEARVDAVDEARIDAGDAGRITIGEGQGMLGDGGDAGMVDGAGMGEDGEGKSNLKLLSKCIGSEIIRNLPYVMASMMYFCTP
jgi:hypothetical protein